MNALLPLDHGGQRRTSRIRPRQPRRRRSRYGNRLGRPDRDRHPDDPESSNGWSPRTGSTRRAVANASSCSHRGADSGREHPETGDRHRFPAGHLKDGSSRAGSGCGRQDVDR